MIVPSCPRWFNMFRLDSNDGDGMPLVRRWSLEAAAAPLIEACRRIGLDINAVRYAGTQSGARVVMPSFFCQEPRDWLAVLAQLAERGETFTITLVETPPDDTDTTVSLLRLFPRVDPVTLEMLAHFSPDRAAVAADFGARIEEAFRHLLNASHSGIIHPVDDGGP